MEEQILNLENRIGAITFEIGQAENEPTRISLEDKYKEEVESLTRQIEQLKNN